MTHTGPNTAPPAGSKAAPKPNYWEQAEKAEDERIAKMNQLFKETGVPFAAGDSICWIHGDINSNRSHYRVATVLEIKGRQVYVEGLTSRYWLNIDKLLLRLNLVPHSHG